MLCFSHSNSDLMISQFSSHHRFPNSECKCKHHCFVVSAGTVFFVVDTLYTGSNFKSPFKIVYILAFLTNPFKLTIYIANLHQHVNARLWHNQSPFKFVYKLAFLSNPFKLTIYIANLHQNADAVLWPTNPHSKLCITWHFRRNPFRLTIYIANLHQNTNARLWPNRSPFKMLYTLAFRTHPFKLTIYISNLYQNANGRLGPRCPDVYILSNWLGVYKRAGGPFLFWRFQC